MTGSSPTTLFTIVVPTVVPGGTVGQVSGGSVVPAIVVVVVVVVDVVVVDVVGDVVVVVVDVVVVGPVGGHHGGRAGSGMKQGPLGSVGLMVVVCAQASVDVRLTSATRNSRTVARLTLRAPG